jgi:Tol biopolymer transport system component/DNA-binding winged helix-turn-helix (wHTH) protein
LSIYEFDDVRVDPRAFRVWKAGHPVALEPKALEVLLFLLENPGRLVEKRELLERVWPDTVVTESAMTRVIADLRKALGDAAREARYIETVPTKGYRFIAEVRKVPDEAPASPSPPDREPVSAPRRLPPRLFWFSAGAVGLVVLIVGLRAMRHRPSRAPERATAPTQAQQVTDSLGLDLFPSFSPDGAQIAYCSDRGGGFEIYVRQLTAGGREIQITSDRQDNLQPAWSPDGREIAYTSRGRPGVWVVPALGGTPRRLTEFGSHPAWSPDGTTLAFQSTGPTDISASAPAAAPPSSLFLVPAAGGTPLPLTRPGSPEGGHGAPAFSPDGETIVFATWALHVGELWTVSRLDGSLHPISTRKGKWSGIGICYEPVYSPRGDRIYFAAAPGTWLNASLWTARVPSSAGESWGEPERVTSPGPASLRQVAISPRRATSIAYAALSSLSNVWSLPIDIRSAAPTGDPVPLTRAAGCRNSGPVFSPDGSHIAFVSCRAGARTDVWVMNADGRNARPLTDDPALNGNESWFPDGERIAFLSARDGSKALWSVTLSDRSEKRLLPIDVEASSARLSPDGRFLALTSGAAGVLTVWVTPLEGGAPRQLTFDREGAGYASWSPDGRFLAVELLRGPDMHIAIVPAAGGEPFIVTRERGLSWPHDWSPDGERIAFAGQRDGVWNVYWISRHGGPEHRLTNYSSRNSFVRYPAWSPRGDQIAYEYAETTGNIWLMDLPR